MRAVAVKKLKANGASCWYVLDPRSRGATQIYHLEPRTLPAQGKHELPYLSSSPRKDEQCTALSGPHPIQGDCNYNQHEHAPLTVSLTALYIIYQSLLIQVGPLGCFIHVSITTPIVSALKNCYI